MTNTFNRFTVQSLWNNTPFNFAYSEPNGKSGGILAVWDTTYFTLIDSLKGEGYLALLGSWYNIEFPCLIVVVYAPHDLREKKVLWNNLTRVIENHNNFSILLGDFNEVRYETERLGTTFNRRSASVFNEFIHSSGLHDLPMRGKRFTRMNSFGNKHSKIYRFLVSNHVVMLWPNTNVLALPREFLDHTPTPVLLKHSAPDFGPTPFKLFNSWLEHRDFPELVKSSWETMVVGHHREGTFNSNGLSMISFKTKLQHLKKTIRQWRSTIQNHDTVASLELRSLIDSLDIKAESSCLSLSEIESRNASIKLLADLECRKVKDLKQKAKLRWAAEGDENSHFFHGIINSRRNRSRINGLNIQGEWITEPLAIKDHIFNSFHARFIEGNHSRPLYSSNLFKQLSVEDSHILDCPFTIEEIKEAVWNCGSSKAPGPDGFSFKFFKKYWSMLEHDIVSFVKVFEVSGLIPWGCNSSFITLVPKVEDPLV
ncbi:cytochrome P450, partial [Tanacetum coccineum]